MPKSPRQCAICLEDAWSQHHITYARDVPSQWALIPLCNRHHEHLHRVHEHVKKRGVPLEVATARYLLDPDGARSLAITDNPDRRLNFVERAMPGGEHWRRWLASVA